MDLPSSNRLCHFYAVCVAQGFNRATDLHYQLFRTLVVQSTLSRSVAEIEAYAGPCIIRDPFGLTPKGHTVFAYAKGLVENFLPIWKDLRADESDILHFGAPEYCVREYLLTLQQRMEEKHGIRLRFHACTEDEIITGVMNGTLHLGVCALNRPLPSGLGARALVEIEPVLLLGRNGGYFRDIHKAADLWSQQTVRRRLICVDEKNSLRTVFDEGLAMMKVSWPERDIAASTALVTMMVATAGHAGLSLNLEKLKTYENVRTLDLPGFPKARYGPVWREPLTDTQKKILREIELIAAESNLTPVSSRAKWQRSGSKLNA